MDGVYLVEKPAVSHVVVDSGVITGCEVPAAIGRRVFTVDIVEAGCDPITTFSGTDYVEALNEASTFRLPIVNLAAVTVDFGGVE